MEGMERVREILEGLGETQPLTSSEEEGVTTSQCHNDLPSGERCNGEIRWVSRNSSSGGYSYCEPCKACVLPWRMHRCFGMLSPDKDVADSIRGGIDQNLGIQPIKTSANEAARNALRPLLTEPGTTRGAFLAGPVGTGKTFLGIHALNALMGHGGFTGLYLPEHKVIEAWRATHDSGSPKRMQWANNLISYAKRAEILLLDDFGQTRGLSGGALDSLEALIMHRYEAGLSMIVTSNRTSDNLEGDRGSRVMSRIIGMAGPMVVCNGSDWRSTS